MLQTGLNVELAEHVGYQPYAVEGRGSGNNRNGSYPKTVITDVGARWRCRCLVTGWAHSNRRRSQNTPAALWPPAPRASERHFSRCSTQGWVLEARLTLVNAVC